MEEITMYEAFDGTVFKYRIECEQYEFEKEGRQLINDLLMYNEEGKEILLTADTNCEDVHYAVLRTQKALDYFCNMNDEQELITKGISEIGAYYYDTYNHEWLLMADKVEELKNELNFYTKILEKI